MGDVNYEALYNLMLSGDPRGAAAAKKLTPEEQRAFFDYQQSLQGGHDPEVGRPDASIGGIPAELAAVGAAGLPRAVGAIVKQPVSAGLGLLKSGAKFWAADAGMSKLGVPYPVRQAVLTALGVKEGLRTPAAAEENLLAKTGTHMTEAEYADYMKRYAAGVGAGAAREVPKPPSVTLRAPAPVPPEPTSTPIPEASTTTTGMTAGPPLAMRGFGMSGSAPDFAVEVSVPKGGPTLRTPTSAPASGRSPEYPPELVKRLLNKTPSDEWQQALRNEAESEYGDPELEATFRQNIERILNAAKPKLRTPQK